MDIEYEGQLWRSQPTDYGNNSFFYAAFGVKKEDGGYYSDRIARIRRRNWLNFLSYFENKPKPKALKETLQSYFKENGWSIENDDDFRKYVDSIMEDRPINLGELTVISTLENIKIIIFDDTNGDPKIILPVTEILENYPLMNTSQFATALVFHKGTRFFKLGPQIVNEENEEKTTTKPKKRLGAGALTAILYQIHLATLVLLRGLEKHQTWRLSVDVADASYFDDLVFEWGPEKAALLLQAKWWKRKVTPGNLLGNKYSGFSLSKCFFAYQEVRSKYNVKNVVLCTNAEIDFGLLLFYINSRSLEEDDFLYFEGIKSMCYTFKEGFISAFIEHLKSYNEANVKRELITEANVKSFLQHFQIVEMCTKMTTLEDAIHLKIIQMKITGEFDSTDYALRLNKKITEWYDGSLSHITQTEAKYVICSIRTDKITERLGGLDLHFKSDKLPFTINKRVLHVVPKVDYILSLLRVSNYLSKEEPKVLFLSSDEIISNIKLMLGAWEFSRCLYLIVYNTGRMEQVKELYDGIIQVLGSSKDKTVIVIGEADDELAALLKSVKETMFQSVEDDATFTDFTEESQEMVLEKAIMFYEASL